MKEKLIYFLNGTTILQCYVYHIYNLLTKQKKNSKNKNTEHDEYFV